MPAVEPLFVPLDRPPQAVSLTVRALLQRVLAGAIRVPSFQRPLRWGATDVVKLFDSLVRGYPVGSLLFWKRAAERDESQQIGAARLPVPGHPDAWWIVDGQQRVTALAAALLDLDHGADTRWVVRFDPLRREFLSGPVASSELGRFVPLAVLGDLRRLGRWFPQSLLDEATQGVVEEIQQRILDYQLSAYLMETDQIAALQGVFARLNSSGVRMRSDEVFQALLGSDRPSSTGIDLNRLQAACDIDGFGQPPRGEVLKAVLAMSGQDPTRRIEEIGESALAGLVSAEEAQNAIARAVDFIQASPTDLQAGCGVPCYSFIPYPVTFVLLSRWFYLFPETDALTRRNLAQWFWRGVVTATHQRAAVSALRHQVRLISGTSAQQAAEALLREVGEPARVDWSLERFNGKNARSRVELLALLDLKPRYQQGLVSWRALVTSGERVAREIISSAAFDGLGMECQELARSAANRALLDTRHTGLGATLRTWDPIVDAEALGSHLLDEEMWRALQLDDAERFLRLRGARVQALVSSFLTVRASLGNPRLLAVSRYADTEPEMDDDHDGEEEPPVEAIGVESEAS